MPAVGHVPENPTEEQTMQNSELSPTVAKMSFAGADLEIMARLGDNSVTIDIVKGGACVHRLTLDDAIAPIEHGWLADLFAREDRVTLTTLKRDADEYVASLNINQG
jgi:hypothetical protein